MRIQVTCLPILTSFAQIFPSELRRLSVVDITAASAAVSRRHMTRKENAPLFMASWLMLLNTDEVGSAVREASAMTKAATILPKNMTDV